MTSTNGSQLHIEGKKVQSIGSVAIAGRQGSYDIIIKKGKIQSIKSAANKADWLVMPPLSDLHMHANRAFTLPGHRPKDFEDAVNMTMQLFEGFTEEQYANQATKLFQQALQHGTSHIRTHADLDDTCGMKAIKGTLIAAEKFEDQLDVDIVAFATSNLDPLSQNAKELFQDAVSQGCKYIGATPVLYDEPKKSIGALLKHAADLGVDVDVHLDEHLNVDLLLADSLAHETIKKDLKGRVTLSHGCVLSVLDENHLEKIIALLSEAQIGVIALPLTNLYLQDKGDRSPKHRGMTPIKALLNGNIDVRLATDNVRDAFYPFGNADLLETMYIGMVTAQIDNPEEVIPMICNGESNIVIGNSADFVLIKGFGLDDVISRRPKERLIIRRGEVVFPPIN